MTQGLPPEPQKRIAEGHADEVMALAAKYYAEQQEGFSESELITAGSEVNIPAELIQRAIQEIEAEKKKADFAAQVNKENRRLLLGLSGLILAITGAWVMVTYNALRSAEAKVDAAWAQVDNQMQRRADLLPTLLLIAEAANQPTSALVQVVRGATEDAKTARTTEQRIAASQQVEAAVAKFSSTYFSSPRGLGRTQGELSQIQYELTGTANRLAVERMRFNQAVEAYNRTISQFPTSILAQAMGMQKRAISSPMSSLRPDAAPGAGSAIPGQSAPGRPRDRR